MHPEKNTVPDDELPVLPERDNRAHVSLRAIFNTFVRIGATSFGGSTQAWVYRSIVEEKRWLTDKEFLAGTAVAQILPGANPKNLALYVGQQMRGWKGAVVAAMGMLTPAFFVVLLMAVVYGSLSRYPLTHFLLIGIATAGVGATFAAGAKVALRMERKLVPNLIAVIAFVTVGILHWSMVPVVAVLAPVSVLLALREARRG